VSAIVDVRAATVTAASCSVSHVQAALNQATAGDTVVIPAGTCRWTTGIDWTAPANVTIRGAGSLSVPGGGDATVIVDDVASGSPVLAVTTNASGAFRIYGLTIRGGTGSIKEGGMVSFGGLSKQFRMDHMHINKTTYSQNNAGKLAYFGGRIKGVVDHNIFTFGSTIGWLHVTNGDIGTQDDHGDVPWSEPTGFGGPDFLYIEDNQFTATFAGDGPPLGTATDCHTGGKFVLRYNTGVNVNFGQTHPTGHAGDDRGCRAHESYGNVATSTVNPQTTEPNFSFDYNNSGPALIWGNSVGGVYKSILYLNICRTDSACGYTPNYGGWGNGSCGDNNIWDGNALQNGYPCLDQPGRGQGDLLNGTFPNKRNTVFGTARWPRNKLEPVYEWLTTGNTVSGWGGSWVSDGDDPQLQQNRDYYLHHGNTGCNPGAGSCTTGVGVGTLAQRPANCTTGSEAGGGVAWWATDQGGNWHTTNGSSNDGALYKCSATNTWTHYYTPYTYPHPLSLGQTPVGSPAAPTGLRIVR
jgi:hypothetical protein